MYQYAEEKLKKDLEKEEIKKNQKEQELQEIKDKLDCITSYDILDNQQFNNIGLAIACIPLGCLFLSPGVYALVKSLFMSSSLGIKLLIIITGLMGAGFLWVGKYYVKEWVSTAKQMKTLKQKGVKKFKKQISELFDKKLTLEKEASTIQSKMDKIIEVLNHIDFFKETVNDPFYQADTKEEYESALENNNLNLLEDDTVIPENHDKPKRKELISTNS